MTAQAQETTREAHLPAALRRAGRCSGVLCALSDPGSQRFGASLSNLLITVQQLPFLVGDSILDIRISPNIDVPGWKNAPLWCAATLACDQHASFKSEENRPVLKLGRGTLRGDPGGSDNHVTRHA